MTPPRALDPVRAAERVADAVRRERRAAIAWSDARAARLDALRQGRAAGLTYAQLGATAGLTAQRVAQLLHTE